ncbi:MAG: hypothetical protein IPJ28_02085 [Betaproteobacteria bacterium]|nr:hypothetical protein [Betaproteobacteria bacterium]
MTPKELKLLKSDSPLVADVITGMDLADPAPRTLVLGVTAELHTWHVYLGRDGAIHRVVYDAGGVRLSHTPEERIAANADYVPARRACPEACDFEFCLKLRQHGLALPFAAWDGMRDGAQAFHGLLDEELEDARPVAMCAA